MPSRREFLERLRKRLGVDPSQIEGLRHKGNFLLTLQPFLDHDELNYYQIARMQRLDPNQVSIFLNMAFKMGLLDRCGRVSTKQTKCWIYTKT